MKTRRLAPVALAAALLLGMTGCSMISPQATTLSYSPADGVNIPASGPLEVRNALLVADESGSAANFLAAIVNDTDATATLMVGIDGVNKSVRVPAKTTVSLGFDGADPLLFEGLDTVPGTDRDMTFQSGDGEGVLQAVPVLDGTLDYLADFVPED
ncbi:MAG: DNA modification methylase [Microbacterium sp. SCN 70-200]|uniref:DNA modification methylase n=1 Tax=unclassified Microbacterium TaxID=2609290 RepID=UPI00086902FD|nr:MULTISPECIES: DNA modification methylase [unclassified Microbacterium]MBN9213568.1 DNA modification methylase [Microbacterium sp.]ODT42279.1 MAG: DNA modification methylase [Microbacterium sp. SCN 70-200]OJV79091.1 MAG: DNA modification methylase [Microbacterium sp. 70-16]